MTIITIDVSHHDWNRRVQHGLPGQLDWARVRASGIEAMCARATYGDPQGVNYSTHHFGDFVRGAAAAGFTLRGGYHNLVHGNQASINRQVDWLRSEIDRYAGTWAMLDVERYAELVRNGMWPRWDDVRAFDDRWAAVDGRPLAIYLPRWLWSGYLGQVDMRVLGGPLVASNYPANLPLAASQLYGRAGGDTGPGWRGYGGKSPALWQFGSRSVVPGASDFPVRTKNANGVDIDAGNDVNAYKGTHAQLTTLLTGEDAIMSAEDVKAIKDALVWEFTKLYGRNPDGGDPTLAKVLAHAEAQAIAAQTRDTATAAAIEALTDLVRAGGGDADTRAILDHIDEHTAQTSRMVNDLQAQLAQARADLAAVEAQRDELAAQLAAGPGDGP